MKKILVVMMLGVLFTGCFSGCGNDKAAATHEVGKKVAQDSVAGDDGGADAADSQAGDASEVEVSDDANAQGGDDASAGVDVKVLADKLLNEISYDDELSDLDIDTAKMFLNIADIDVAEYGIYESSGATAEEIVVLKCLDSDGAFSAKKAFEQRVSEKIENFTDYVPEEVPKLKDAVIITSNEYAVLCVSNDSAKAKSIIEGAFTK